jgi:hypothetical protein
LHRYVATEDELVEKDRFLPFEVAEDGAACDTRVLRDLIHCRFGEPLTDEELEGDLRDSAPRRVGVPFSKRRSHEAGS